jgi:hypothetical protein
MARSLFLLAILMASAAAPAPAAAQNAPIPLPPFLTPRGTPEDQRACRSDASKLCKDYLGNDDQVLRCFQANRQRLTPSCNAVLVMYGR